MAQRVVGLTGATLEHAPSVCQTCVWWQSRNGRSAGKERWIEKAEACIGRCDQVASAGPIVEPDADVACGRMGITTLKQASSDAADLFAGLRFVHASIANALTKKSSAPKLPDFRAMCRW